MRLSALKHLLEVTLALSHPERIRILGSSALLAAFPELGEAGQPLEVGGKVASQSVRERLDSLPLTEAEILRVFRRLQEVSV